MSLYIPLSDLTVVVSKVRVVCVVTVEASRLVLPIVLQVYVNVFLLYTLGQIQAQCTLLVLPSNSSQVDGQYRGQTNCEGTRTNTGVMHCAIELISSVE